MSKIDSKALKEVVKVVKTPRNRLPLSWVVSSSIISLSFHVCIFHSSTQKIMKIMKTVQTKYNHFN